MDPRAVSTGPDLAARVARVRERIAAAGADPSAVTLVAVTKGMAAGRALAAVDAGVLDLGESYAQELVAKADEVADAAERAGRAAGPGGPLPPAPRWHFVGRLQRNKVRLVAPYVHLWQSVDRLSLAAEVARHQPGAHVLVQVNVSGAEQQGGCAPERVAAVVEGCADLGLEVRGLMAIGPQGTDTEVRRAFGVVAQLADRLGLAERSMGMSSDLELAVAEGATMVRVGTALFGPRGSAATVGQ
jgi:pyridoxal phosphate enzyme (YggS family)